MSQDHILDFRRAGRITASIVGAILRLDTGHSRKWAWRVVMGREPERTNLDMQRGLEHEIDALLSFEVKHACLIEQVGFVPHPTIDWLGASPDGMIRENSFRVTIEAKCPRILHGAVPPKYNAQMQTQMQCCDAAYGYFLSWTNSEFRYIKVERDEKWWQEVALPELTEFYTLYVKPDVEPPRSPSRRVKSASEV